MFARTVAFSLTWLLLLVGCNNTEVRVNSFLSQEIEFPAAETARIRIIAETHPPNALFEAEVARQISRLLQDQGFKGAAGDAEQGDYTLLCFFASDSGTVQTGTRAVEEPGRYVTSRYYTDSGRWAIRRTYVPGATRYVPYSETVFHRRLDLTLFMGSLPTTQEAEGEPGRVAWQATAQSAGSSADLRGAVPHLLVAAFEFWGQDSGCEQKATIKNDDKRIHRLMGREAGPDESGAKQAE